MKISELKRTGVVLLIIMFVIFAPYLLGNTIDSDAPIFICWCLGIVTTIFFGTIMLILWFLAIAKAINYIFDRDIFYSFWD